MALDNDFQSADYNSYFVDVAAIDAAVALLDGIVDISLWTALNDTQKENVSLASTVDVNDFCWNGIPNTEIISIFNMQWPREGTFYNNDVKIDDEEIPFFVTDYVARRSVERLSYDENNAVNKYLDRNVASQKVGSLSQSFFKANDNGSPLVNTKKLPSYQIVKPYVCNSVDTLTYLVRS